MLEDSAWAPLRSRIFFALFVAELVSNLGSLMQSVGAAWLIGDLGGSATLIALVQTAATFLPMFLVGIPAGALADILDRRRIIMASHAAMVVLAFALAALSFSDRVTPAGVLGLTFGLGLVGAMNAPAFMAIQPDLVPKHQFPQAVALGALTYNVGRALGPALGGLVVAIAGPGWVFALNGLSFLAILLVVSRWQPPQLSSASPAESFSGATRAGLRFAAHSSLLRSVLARVALLMFPGAALQALLPVVARGPLGLGSGGYGLLLGCFGIGAALAALLRPRIARRLSSEQMVVVSSWVVVATLLAQGYVSQPLVLGAALFIGGIAWSTAAIVMMVSAQGSLPAWVRARGMALYTLVLTGSLAFGSALAGVLAGRDLRKANVVAAVAVALGTLVSRRWPIVSTQDVDLTMIPGDAPVVVLTPSPADGPVLVTITYCVAEAEMEGFVERMRYIERHRRGTGAYRWGLFRDLAVPDRFLETFVVASWAEHLRQHHRRTAVADELLQSVRPFMVTENAVAHLLSAYGEGGVEHRAPSPDVELLVEEI